MPKTYGNQWLESIAVSGDAHRGATGADKDGERGAWVGGERDGDVPWTLKERHDAEEDGEDVEAQAHADE